MLVYYQGVTADSVCVVHVEWLKECLRTYRRLEESSFPLPGCEDASKRRVAPLTAPDSVEASDHDAADSDADDGRGVERESKRVRADSVSNSTGNSSDDGDMDFEVRYHNMPLDTHVAVWASIGCASVSCSPRTTCYRLAIHDRYRHTTTLLCGLLLTRHLRFTYANN